MSGPPGSDSKACPTPRLRSSSMQLIFMARGFGSSGGIERVIVDVACGSRLCENAPSRDLLRIFFLGCALTMMSEDFLAAVSPKSRPKFYFEKERLSFHTAWVISALFATSPTWRVHFRAPPDLNPRPERRPCPPPSPRLGSR